MQNFIDSYYSSSQSCFISIFSLHRLQLLGVLASRLSTSRVGETDLTVPAMKILSYLPPLPGTIRMASKMAVSSK